MKGRRNGEVVSTNCGRASAIQYLGRIRGCRFRADIAWLLGYEGSTSFNHAFRRWTRAARRPKFENEKLPSCTSLRTGEHSLSARERMTPATIDSKI